MTVAWKREPKRPCLDHHSVAQKLNEPFAKLGHKASRFVTEKAHRRRFKPITAPRCARLSSHTCVGHYLLFQGKYQHHCRIQTLHLIFSFELERIQNVLCDGRSTHFGTFYVFGAIRTPMATLWSSQHNFGEEMRLFCVSVSDEVTIKCLSNSWSSVFSWSSRRSSRRSVQTSAAAFLCEDTGLDWLLRKWFQAVFRARLQRLIFKTENPILTNSSCLAFSSTIRAALSPYAEKFWSKDFKLCIFVQLCSDWWHLHLLNTCYRRMFMGLI